ncbi:alpha-ketoglutarate-dependent dioxygenase AlkB [cyanobiont of Ornithocercus magnificus]|nr:alpha-ketoglutarate-dependent dioxygenase AlkB [cyanobiont of Ornithocercus magnificus]
MNTGSTWPELTASAGGNQPPWRLIKGWLSSATSQSWHRQIVRLVTWQQPRVAVYGRHYFAPRQAAFLADVNITYRYSGCIHHGEGQPKWFLPLSERVANAAAETFNGCLLNLYRNGNDCMGWHADDEPELVCGATIASLSLGASRNFVLRHRYTSARAMLLLEDGDLLLMYYPCQQDWQHSLPKRRKVIEQRINLTFRRFQVQ